MKNSVVVTGATSGIGYAICEALLDSGYPIIGIGRSEDSCSAAKASLEASRPGTKVHFIAADFMLQREVLRVAREIESSMTNCGGRIHALINNAGCVRSRFMTTEEGYEQQFALNHLAGFLLTHKLMPLIKRDNTAVIFTSSSSHKNICVNWDDLMYQKMYNPLYAYKQSKLCNLLTAHRLREMGVRAVGVDPGLVRTEIGNKDTDGVVDIVWNLRKKYGILPEESAQIYLSLCEDGFSGLYYGASRHLNQKPGPGSEKQSFAANVQYRMKNAKSWASGTLQSITPGDSKSEGQEPGEFRSVERRTSNQVTSANARRLYEISMKLCGIDTKQSKNNEENSKHGYL